MKQPRPIHPGATRVCVNNPRAFPVARPSASKLPEGNLADSREDAFDRRLQPTFSVFKDEHPYLVWLPVSQTKPKPRSLPGGSVGFTPLGPATADRSEFVSAWRSLPLAVGTTEPSASRRLTPCLNRSGKQLRWGLTKAGSASTPVTRPKHCRPRMPSIAGSPFEPALATGLATVHQLATSFTRSLHDPWLEHPPSETLSRPSDVQTSPVDFYSTTRPTDTPVSHRSSSGAAVPAPSSNGTRKHRCWPRVIEVRNPALRPRRAPPRPAPGHRLSPSRAHESRDAPAAATRSRPRFRRPSRKRNAFVETGCLPPAAFHLFGRRSYAERPLGGSPLPRSDAFSTGPT